MVITALAARLGSRIDAPAYLDAFLPGVGEAYRTIIANQCFTPRPVSPVFRRLAGGLAVSPVDPHRRAALHRRIAQSPSSPTPLRRCLAANALPPPRRSGARLSRLGVSRSAVRPRRDGRGNQSGYRPAARLRRLVVPEVEFEQHAVRVLCENLAQADCLDEVHFVLHPPRIEPRDHLVIARAA